LLCQEEVLKTLKFFLELSRIHDLMNVSKSERSGRSEQVLVMNWLGELVQSVTLN
jgi:hypothetical protein